jgi:hypothetical protein
VKCGEWTAPVGGLQLSRAERGGWLIDEADHQSTMRTRRRTSQCSHLTVAAGLRDDEMAPAESCDGDAAFNFNSNRRSSLIPPDFPSADCEHKETTPGAAAGQPSATSTIGIGRLDAVR